MTPSEPVVDSPQGVPIVIPAPRRERVVRRRRSRSHGHRRGTGEWTVRRSRRRIIRAVVVSAAMLVLMAVGLYFGLSRQDGRAGQRTPATPVRATSKPG